MNAISEFRPSGRHGLAALGVLALAVSACGGSGGDIPVTGVGGPSGCVPSDPATADSCGNVIVALTDADGDFTSYTVDIQSISLERANGTRIEMLPQTIRADFARLTDLSEIISTATMAPGNIVGGHIRIDYSDAEIYVEAGGEIVPVDVYDGGGTLLTDESADSIVDVEIRLPESDRLFVTRGRSFLFSIDFDLEASHVVDTTVDPVSVVARPYLIAEVQPVDEKEIRVRGSLVSVDVDARTYDIELRPWHHRVGNWGVFTVITDDETEFEIDDVAYVGLRGLETLARKPEGTVTVAFGTLSLADRTFTADIVHAGDSVGGDRYAAVIGNIVSRTGDELVMKGAVAIRTDRRAHFHRTVIVNIGPETKVTRVGDAGTEYDPDDLSVGQRTIVFGRFLNPAVDNTDRFGPDIALVLDATEGRARMLVTRLRGTVNSFVPGEIELRLWTIDRLSAGMFHFAGTGVSPPEDADPAHYQVATSTLPLDALEVGRPVRILGFVTTFGEAPPDFRGRSLVGPNDLPAALGVGWGIEGTAAPFSLMNPDSLVINLDNPDIGIRHHMLIGPTLVDLFDLPASPGIEQSALPRVYGIWEPGHIELFKDFADFVDELALRLGEADRARSLSAYGRYDESRNALTANKVVVHMLPAGTP